MFGATGMDLEGLGACSSKRSNTSSVDAQPHSEHEHVKPESPNDDVMLLKVVRDRLPPFVRFM
jgi:hypothetical protein